MTGRRRLIQGPASGPGAGCTPGTSGFAYPAWAPRFYSAGTRSDGLLRAYADRLPAVELNNTFYQQPKPDKIAAWLAATPADFRFVVKAQRGGSMRAFGEAAARDGRVADGSVSAVRGAARLGPLSRAGQVHRDEEKLRALLDAWPADMPLTLEAQHASWQDDAIFDLLRAHGAAVCATDLDDEDAPDLRLTGRFIYLRLRRTTYTDADLADWAARLRAFFDSGTDCYVFFRHDDDGTFRDPSLHAASLRPTLPSTCRCDSADQTAAALSANQPSRAGEPPRGVGRPMDAKRDTGVAHHQPGDRGRPEALSAVASVAARRRRQRIASATARTTCPLGKAKLSNPKNWLTAAAVRSLALDEQLHADAARV